MEHTEANENNNDAASIRADSNDGANEIAGQAESKVRHLRDRARSQAEDRLHVIGDKARQRAGMAQERIDQRRDQVASNIEGAASRLRHRSDAAGSFGHTLAEPVAQRMEAAAGYLHQRRSDEIAGDLDAYVRKHPIQSVIIAAILGFLAGRILG